ncbi:HutD/Ves family protein [Paraburkholderia phenoliruptrix]|uniref:HutD/Ves family protein n=1 Tax=Paraburkholderia phenoliruptrix TaxID=252970 RepID=UPI002869DB26|nr:HutD family protein [Paraburkholderia phenoliruptrix]WMY06956.1 HutD family protein [Paraburkholderia phenoliruptrix]
MTLASGTVAGANACASSVTLIRAAELAALPWKNGGGVTREVAAHPADAGLDGFVWRMSVADVAQAGPFSRFAGIDRTLVLLSGAGMLLDEAHSDNAVKTHALTRPLDIARFAGEARIDARLVDGPTRDFNLMVRRGAARGELEVWRQTQQVQKARQMQQSTQPQSERTLSADVALLYCASGALTVTLGDARANARADAQRHQLQTGDTLRIEAPNALSCTMEGEGALLAIRLRYTPE